MKTANIDAAAEREEARIRELMEEWRTAMCARDLDRMMTHYAPDVVFFDATPPFQHEGAAAYRRTWELCFPYLPEKLGSEVKELNITAGADTAFAHCLHRLTNVETGQAATCGWVRVTVCYQKLDGAWKVTHEHVSVPFDPQTAHAVFSREADQAATDY